MIFNTYVTMTNAARDAARMGTIYVYTRESGETQATNDLARNESIKTQVLAAMNMLGKVSPYFTTGSTWTQSGSTYTNGDLVISYVLPTGVTNSETRTGQEVTVRATYHQDLIVPIIPLFLPTRQQRPVHGHRRSHDGDQLMRRRSFRPTRAGRPPARSS